MEQLHNGLTLELSPGAFPLSTDSVILSGFVHLGKNATVLDLGSGCGTLGLLLCAEDPSCHVVGVELDEMAHNAALENIRRNKLSGRIESICADLKTIDRLVKPGSFSACVSNPPYFSGGPASATHATARREDCCTLEDIFRSAAWSVKYGGDFFLVHRPERLAEIFACAAAVHLEPKRLCLVRHKPGDGVSLVLVQCRKGAKPGLLWEDLILHESDGSPSGAYRKLYHL
jgi:tRNA1Val (adenine37-N6)-methyltransferase